MTAQSKMIYNKLYIVVNEQFNEYKIKTQTPSWFSLAAQHLCFFSCIQGILSNFNIQTKQNMIMKVNLYQYN